MEAMRPWLRSRKKQKKAKPQASARARAAGTAATPAAHRAPLLPGHRRLPSAELSEAGRHGVPHAHRLRRPFFGQGRPGDLIDDIVADIKGRHRRQDRRSRRHATSIGTTSPASSTARDIFKDFRRQARYGWHGPRTRPTRMPSQLDKFKGQALAALQGAEPEARSRPRIRALHLAGIRDGLQAVLGFQFGAKGDKVRARARRRRQTARRKAADLSRTGHSRRSRSTDCPICASTCSVRRATRRLLRLEEKAERNVPAVGAPRLAACSAR